MQRTQEYNFNGQDRLGTVYPMESLRTKASIGVSLRDIYKRECGWTIRLAELFFRVVWLCLCYIASCSIKTGYSEITVQLVNIY